MGIKAFFPYDAGEADLDAEFGKISVFTFNTRTNAYDANLLIDPARNPAVSYKTKNNLNWLSDNQANGYGYVHSQTTPVGAVNANNYGVKVNAK